MTGSWRRTALITTGCVLVAGIGVWYGFQRLVAHITHDPFGASGVAVSSPAPVPSPRPSVDDSNPALQQVLIDLETRVLKSAGTPGDVTGTCTAPGFTGAQPAQFGCTVTYEGLTVRYSVNATPGGDASFTWMAKPDSVIVTRAGILAAFWRRFHAESSDLRCDADLPAKAVVQLNAPLAQSCYLRPPHAKTIVVHIRPADSQVKFTED